MFDFIADVLRPGESAEDAHHLGLMVHNPHEQQAELLLYVGSIALDLRLAPNDGLILTDEQSAGYVRVENRGPVALRIEWRKTRD